MIASGGAAPALAAKAATSTIPIVFTAAAEPVELGLVESLGRPGGNLTGSTAFTTSLDPKRLELLKELMPEARVFGVLRNPARPNAENDWRALHNTGFSLGLRILSVQASSEGELEGAFESAVSKGFEALLVAADPLFNGRTPQARQVSGTLSHSDDLSGSGICDCGGPDHVRGKHHGSITAKRASMRVGS